MTVALALTALLFTACSNNTGDQNATQNDTTAAVTEQASLAEPVITDQGIAPVLIGADIKDIPESVEGLYAKREYKSFNDVDDEERGWTDVDGWYFYDADGNKLFAAETTKKEGKDVIYSILVYSPTIKTAQGAHVGMSRQELVAIEGAKYIEPNPEADYEIHIFELGKISITMDNENKNVTDMRLLQESLLDH